MTIRDITNKEDVFAWMQKNLSQPTEEVIQKEAGKKDQIDPETRKRWLTPSIIPQN